MIVDSGSTDATASIVEGFATRGFPIRFIHRQWPGYARQKQFALEQASQPWVLSIDADEWLDDELRAHLPELLRAGEEVAGYKLRRAITLYGRPAPAPPITHPERILRLVRAGRARFDENVLVHEGLSVDGETPVAPHGVIRHERALPIDEQMLKEINYARLKARQRVDAGAAPSAFKLVFNPPNYFFRAYVLHRMFLCGRPGFIHAMTGAIYSFLAEAMHFQLWASRNSRTSGGSLTSGRRP